jgi:hypothetical protein
MHEICKCEWQILISSASLLFNQILYKMACQKITCPAKLASSDTSSNVKMGYDFQLPQTMHLVQSVSSLSQPILVSKLSNSSRSSAPKQNSKFWSGH